MLKKLIHSLSLFLSLSAAFGQTKWSDGLEIEFNYGRGYILAEYQFINLVTEGPSQNFEISLHKTTFGENDWQIIYGYPSYGLRFHYGDLGSPDVLGENWALYPYFRIPIVNFERFKFSTEVGLGFSRVNKKFDLEDNYLNVAVGSYNNFHFNSRLNASYQVNDRFRLSSSLSFDHFSNANAAEPNLGINYLSWLGGICYAVGDQKEKIKRELATHQADIETELVFSIGGKHSRALTSKYYLTNALSFEIRKKYFRAFHLGIGADLFYDNSVEDQLEDQDKKFSPVDKLQSGIHLSQTIVYNRISIVLQEGIYLGFEEKVEGYRIYSRGIFKYRFTKHFTGRLTMKSHLHILDYPEIGIGWIF